MDVATLEAMKLNWQPYLDKFWANVSKLCYQQDLLNKFLEELNAQKTIFVRWVYYKML